MSNFYQDTDAATTERISAQRDAIYEGVVSQFRNLMAKERVDDALALADEFFEWMDPNQLEEEEPKQHAEATGYLTVMSEPKTLILCLTGFFFQ